MSALTLNVAGSTRGAPASGLAPRDDRAANKESGDVFASVLDGTASDSSDAVRTLTARTRRRRPGFRRCRRRAGRATGSRH